MKRYLALGLTIALVAGSFMVGCRLKHEHETKEPQQKTSITVSYTCPMHPEVVSDKPGKCPKCGMNLVEKE